MSIKNLSVTASSNNSAPPNGSPEGSTYLGDVSNIFRQLMADLRTLAAADTIAAATTTDIGSKDSTFLTLTGSAATITGLGTVSAGIYKVVIYNAAHTLTYNATSLILIGNADRTVAAGDISLFVSEGTGNWREVLFSDDTGYLVKDKTAVLTAGYSTTPYDAGTKSSGTFTPDEANGHFQYCVNGGVFTLAPSTNNTTIVIQVTNNASAGAITTSGFTAVKGDTLTTTNGDDFMLYLTTNNSKSVLNVVALQ